VQQSFLRGAARAVPVRVAAAYCACWEATGARTGRFLSFFTIGCCEDDAPAADFGKAGLSNDGNDAASTK
jgi:hypothetical protein